MNISHSFEFNACIIVDNYLDVIAVNKSILGNALTNAIFINGFIQNFSRDAAMD